MISVIVPIYNVEKYVNRCIDSLLNQSFTDYEIILVNDGSTDNSEEKCNKYKKLESVRYFDKENGGLSDARNFGLNKARGDYITFVDSDDYVGTDYLKVLYEAIDANCSDMSCLHIHPIYTENTLFFQSKNQFTNYNTKKAFESMLISKPFGLSATAKLFKAELFDDSYFEKGIFYEDLFLVPYIIDKCKKITYCSSTQYYYFQNNSSITHTVTEAKIRTWEEGIEKLYNYTLNKYPDLEKCVKARYISMIYSTIINNMFNDDDYYDKCYEIKKRRKDWWKTYFVNNHISIKNKVNTMFFVFDPRLYRSIKQIWRKFKNE